MKIKSLKNKKFIKLTSFFVLAFLLFLISCKKEDTPTPTSNQSSGAASFAKVGHEWSYLVTDSAKNDTFLLRITNDLMNGYFKCADYDSTYGWDTTYIFSNDSVIYGENDYMNVPTDYIDQPLEIFLKKNSAINDNYLTIYPITVYTQDSNYVENDTIYHKVISLSENITVPAGSFDCAKILRTNPFGSSIDSSYYYINKNYGLIRVENLTWNTTVSLIQKNF